MPKRKSPIALFLAIVIVIALLALLDPEEKSLGASVWIVYLHGWLINTDWITSAAKIAFIIVLWFALSTAEKITYPPPSPIFNSGNDAMIAFFAALILMPLVAAHFLTRVFLQKTSQ